MFRFGCEGLWQHGLTSDLPARNSAFMPSYRTAPMGAVSSFGHISIQTNRNVNEKPRLLPLILTFACAIGQKRASVPRRAPWGPSECRTACLIAPITTNTQPLPYWEPESIHRTSEWVNVGVRMNILQVIICADTSCLSLTLPLRHKYTAPCHILINWKVPCGEW